MVLLGFNNTLSMNSNIPFYQNNAKLLSVIYLCQMIFLVSINMMMFTLFIYLFHFLLEFRTSKLCERRLSLFNRFIICWVFFLCLLVFVHITNDMIIGIGVAKSESTAIFIREPIFVYYGVTCSKIIMPIRDLFIAISFCYLYYY